jgi:ElaB/YqjD/DUF883 family membrane-anchored ribosome-binding protein
MDEAPRTSSPTVETDTSDQPRSPEEIRAEIERTREELGDTAAAVAQKADVKAQAKARVDDTKASQVVGQAATTARENPLPVAAGAAFVAGFLLGRFFGRRS